MLFFSGGRGWAEKKKELVTAETGEIEEPPTRLIDDVMQEKRLMRSIMKRGTKIGNLRPFYYRPCLPSRFVSLIHDPLPVLSLVVYLQSNMYGASSHDTETIQLGAGLGYFRSLMMFSVHYLGPSLTNGLPRFPGTLFTKFP